MELIKEKGLYRAMSGETLSRIQKLNREEQCSFLIPTRFISKENAQLAYIVNEYYNLGRKKETLFRSFFVNSRYEAIQGAIKLMRQNASKRRRNRIIIFDEQNELQRLFNPLDNQDNYLIPGLEFIDNWSELTDIVNKYDQILGVILLNSLNRYDYSHLIGQCKEKRIISLWVDGDHIPGDIFLPHDFSNLPDMIILGEALTDYEVPFALFSMTEEAHKPWTSMSYSLLHSSTYSGNKLAVESAKFKMYGASFFRQSLSIQENCKEIENSFERAVSAFGKYINPGMVDFYKMLGYDFICKQAHGSWITIESKKEKTTQLLDCVSGGGAAVCGHSPKDVDHCVKDYNTDTNYIKELEEKLKELFLFPYLFPAVSGATAVENGLILTLLASEGKKKIITFENNYGGNTLISLILTGNKEIHQIFSPNYQYVIYIDPFAPDAKERLKSEIQKGDVALVWMELVQGGTLDRIPNDLLEIVRENKDRYGYWVGIDEILMGLYRLDEIASYTDTVLQPDIITFSKALTFGTFPVAATLVSEELMKKATARNKRLVDEMRTFYANQFGAYIAINSIERLIESEQIKKCKNVSNVLKNGLEDIKKDNPYLSALKGEGHIYALDYKSEWMSYYFCKKAIKDQGLFIYIDRIVPALSMSEEEAKELILRLKRLYDIKNPHLFKLKSMFIKAWINLQFVVK